MAYYKEPTVCLYKRGSENGSPVYVSGMDGSDGVVTGLASSILLHVRMSRIYYC